MLRSLEAFTLASARLRVVMFMSLMLSFSPLNSEELSTFMKSDYVNGNSVVRVVFIFFQMRGKHA